MIVKLLKRQKIAVVDLIVTFNRKFFHSLPVIGPLPRSKTFLEFGLIARLGFANIAPEKFNHEKNKSSLYMKNLPSVCTFVMRKEMV